MKNESFTSLANEYDVLFAKKEKEYSDYLMNQKEILLNMEENELLLKWFELDEDNYWEACCYLGDYYRQNFMKQLRDFLAKVHEETYEDWLYDLPYEKTLDIMDEHGQTDRFLRDFKQKIVEDLVERID